MRTIGSSSAGEAVVRQTNHSPLSRAEFQNGWRAVAQPQEYWAITNLACTEKTFILLLV